MKVTQKIKCKNLSCPNLLDRSANEGHRKPKLKSTWFKIATLDSSAKVIADIVWNLDLHFKLSQLLKVFLLNEIKKDWQNKLS